ncbi:MAG: GH1 family beta-glucosidase [bacterium]
MAEFLKFPEGFLWGAATASYQIEGGYDEGGKGESIWDRFCKNPGNIQNGDTGNLACDHYHRYREDIGLMKEIGLKAYRFSVSWPRIFPEGKGKVNQRGLAFYNRLVDGLLRVGIEPFITLYHWDLPQALQDRGGWANEEIVGYFRDYAATVSSSLGDRVHNWITHNEPWVVAFLGYHRGIHAPGIKDIYTAVRVSHNLLLSHGEAVQAIRKNAGRRARVGITLNLSPIHPASESEEDVKASRLADGYLNRWFLDPVFKGAYPEDILEKYGDKAPKIRPADMKKISRRIDFLGVNYYTRQVVKSEPKTGEPTPVGKIKGSKYTAMGWEIYPQGLYELLKRIHDEYGAPTMYITENGAAFPDKVDEKGEVNDPRRVRYLRDHFAQAHRAIGDGIDLRGYFVWSLMDNFEWAHGYSKRFGITYVDYPTQKRIIKRSGLWYKDVIEKGGVRI